MKSGRSANRILTWAIAVSIALHLAVAIVAHAPSAVLAAVEQSPTHVVIVHVVPPPTPTPQPVRHAPSAVRAPSRSHAVAHVRIAAPHVANAGPNSGPAEALPIAASGPPVSNDLPGSPVPSPKPACSEPDVPAHTLEAVSPSAPDDAAGVAGTAEVVVTLDAAGRVTDARIYRSTNDMRLDRAAVIAARQSTYAPALVDCLPTGGQYLFRVDFQS